MTDTTAQPEASPAAPRRGGMRTIGLSAAGFAAGLAVGLLLVGPALAGNDSATARPRASAAAEDSAQQAARGRAIHLIDNIVLNPAQSGGTRFLLLAVAAEVADAGIVEELKTRDAEVRDVLLRVVGANTVERLMDLSVRDSLRAHLADSLGVLLSRRNAVRRVYFPQFVVQ